MLPKGGKIKKYHTRNIDSAKTLNQEQIKALINASKGTQIYIEILLAVLMGLRKSEIRGLKYSDIDFINQTLTVQRQLGNAFVMDKDNNEIIVEDYRDIPLKTRSSYRVLPIPDYVMDALMKEREKYENNKIRAGEAFQDLGYICCTEIGKPRSKEHHYKLYKTLLAENGLPNIRWHDLRSTYCTMLLKNDFNPKAVSNLMGHAKEIITIDVYGDNKAMMVDCTQEIDMFINELSLDQFVEKTGNSECICVGLNDL